MNLASLFMRHILKDQGDIYFPYSFSGEWQDKDKQVIISTLLYYGVPEKVDATFNNWKFLSNGSDWFYAVRSTWESGCLSGSTVNELVQKIHEYYKH